MLSLYEFMKLVGRAYSKLRFYVFLDKHFRFDVLKNVYKDHIYT